jgi:putative GTP pyrophosphokinase
LRTVKSIIDSLLEREGIKYYHVQTRVKEFSTFESKLAKKKYSHPEEMIDFAGLRVIYYLLRDKKIISGLLEDNFHVLDKEDKSLKIGVDKMGYNAIHLDAMLAEDRSNLPEYQYLKGLKFEIQITTILQHTYSEIEHDLIYKNTGSVLPNEIERSIKNISSMLEGLDYQFEFIMDKIDNHKKSLNEKLDKNVLDVQIDSPSLRRYLLSKFGDISDFKPQYGSVDDTEIIEQLHSMGIYTLAEFEKIIPNNFKQKYEKIPKSGYGTYATGLVVWFLIIHDPKKYFEVAYKKTYGIFNSHDYRVFREFGVDTSKLPSDIFDCD